MVTSAASPLSPVPAAADLLAEMLGRARLQVLRATLVIGLLIALGNLAGSFGASVVGPAPELAAGWCLLWVLAAAFPGLTARCLEHWQITGIGLAAANAATVALTGGVGSSVLAVCMYVGWIASVVVSTRATIVMSLLICASMVAGYLLAGDSVADIFTGRHRHDAVDSAALPLLTGVVGVLLASVANSIFLHLADVLEGIRGGAPASTPGLTALLAGQPLLGGGTRPTNARPPVTTPVPLTNAEAEVVAALASGQRAKQIARLRGVGLATVRLQIKTAKKKTGARTLDELVLLAPTDGA